MFHCRLLIFKQMDLFCAFTGPRYLLVKEHPITILMYQLLMMHDYIHNSILKVKTVRMKAKQGNKE